MTQLKQLLKTLIMIDGIDSAVVVSRDGFLLEGISNEKLDSDALGAVISTGFGSAQIMGRELRTGAVRQSLVEYGEGVIVTRTLDDDTLLSVIAGVEANLGNIRYQVKRLLPDLKRALRPLPAQPFIQRRPKPF